MNTDLSFTDTSGIKNTGRKHCTTCKYILLTVQPRSNDAKYVRPVCTYLQSFFAKYVLRAYNM